MALGTFDAALFDLDGTLADTLADIAAAMNAVLTARDLPTHDHAAYRSMVGEGVAVLAARAAPGASVDLVAAFRERYLAGLVVETRPFDGVTEALAALAASGKQLAVLSNKPHDATVHIVAQLFPTIAFAAVWGQRPELPRKPDPTAAVALAAVLHTPPARCAFVGDTAVDMETAVRAGMIGVGALWGYRERAELVAAGARHLCATPSELVTLP
jgi:phosphoglycolate phosphatase